MRHPENVKDDCPKTAKHQTTEKPRRTNHIDDINTKLFLSNTIDGLEHSEIVDKSLTTKIVFMMTSDVDKRKNPTTNGGLKIKKTLKMSPKLVNNKSPKKVKILVNQQNFL